MASANSITAEITLAVKFSAHPDFSQWRIGLTQDLPGSYGRLKSLPSFMYREADSLQEARDVEAFFISEHRMQPDDRQPLPPGQPACVYIYIAAELA